MQADAAGKGKDQRITNCTLCHWGVFKYEKWVWGNWDGRIGISHDKCAKAYVAARKKIKQTRISD